MKLRDAIRAVVGTEAGRTFACNESTNLIVEDSLFGEVPICSSCMTTEMLREAKVSDRDRLAKCSGTRIMGENTKSYSTRTLSVDVRIRGGYQKSEFEKIEKQCHQLGDAATALVEREDFSAVLITYRDGRYRVYGVGLGPHFPIGSRIILAELRFDLVDDRFESVRPKSEDVARFNAALESQMQQAMTTFSTDLHD